MGAFLQKVGAFLWKYRNQIIFLYNILSKYLKFKKTKNMSEELGIFSSDFEKWLGKGLADLIKKEGFWNKALSVGLPQVIKLIDNNLGEKVPEEYRTQIREAIDEIVFEKDYDTAVEMVLDLADDFIDVPGLDDEAESALFNGLGQLICAVLHSIKKDTTKDIEAPDGINK